MLVRHTVLILRLILSNLHTIQIIRDCMIVCERFSFLFHCALVKVNKATFDKNGPFKKNKYTVG